MILLNTLPQSSGACTYTLVCNMLYTGFILVFKVCLLRFLGALSYLFKWGCNLGADETYTNQWT